MQVKKQVNFEWSVDFFKSKLFLILYTFPLIIVCSFIALLGIVILMAMLLTCLATIIAIIAAIPLWAMFNIYSVIFQSFFRIRIFENFIGHDYFFGLLERPVDMWSDFIGKLFDWSVSLFDSYVQHGEQSLELIILGILNYKPITVSIKSDKEKEIIEWLDSNTCLYCHHYSTTKEKIYTLEGWSMYPHTFWLSTNELGTLFQIMNGHIVRDVRHNKVYYLEV